MAAFDHDAADAAAHSDNKNEYTEYPTYGMMNIEDMSEYPVNCFWDLDFQFLDEVTEEELYESDTNKVLGIGSKESIMYVPGQIHY